MGLWSSAEAVQATGFLRGRTNRWPELHELAMGNDTLLADPGVCRNQPQGGSVNDEALAASRGSGV